MTARRPLRSGNVASRSFIGGFRLGRWGGYATWPLVRLTLDAQGIMLGPAARWLSILIATYVVPWQGIATIEPTGSRVRFSFTEMIHPQKRNGPWAWLCLSQSTIDFWCGRRRQSDVMRAALSWAGRDTGGQPT